MPPSKKRRRVKVKALSVRQPFASWIAEGKKTLEVRSWYTHHRGPLLICSSRNPKFSNLPCGYAVALVEVTGCRRVKSMRDVSKAMCEEIHSGDWLWELRVVKALSPTPILGALGLFDVLMEGTKVIRRL